MFKHKFLTIFSIIFIIGILFIVIPFISNKDNYNLLHDKFIKLNDLYKKNIYTVTNSKKITMSRNKDKYLNNLLSSYYSTYELINNEKFLEIMNLHEVNSDNIDENIKYITDLKSQIMSSKKEFNDLINNKKNLKKVDSNNNYIGNINYKKMKKFINSTDYIESDINQMIDVLTYLKNNSDKWSIESDILIINKRANYNEFSGICSLLKKTTFKYKLIDDTVGPNIVGDDISIYVGNNINISDKIKCVDDVDGDVECSISGSYDNSTVGDYSYEISAIDKEGNVSNRTINVKVKDRNSSINMNRYYIEVLRNKNVVIVYELDENDEYTKVSKVFTCSTGKDNATPTGVFSTTSGATWGALFGGVWGQYTTRIVGSILFHSVPYYSKDKGDLEWEEYNKLGEQASLGCVRLSVADAKWIFYNISPGTTVKIYDGDIPDGIFKPDTLKIDGNSENRGWDPTDDDPSNPVNN